MKKINRELMEENRYFVYLTEEQNVILGERVTARKAEVKVEEQDQKYAALTSDSLGGAAGYI